MFSTHVLGDDERAFREPPPKAGQHVLRRDPCLCNAPNVVFVFVVEVLRRLTKVWEAADGGGWMCCRFMEVTLMSISGCAYGYSDFSILTIHSQGYYDIVALGLMS